MTVYRVEIIDNDTRRTENRTCDSNWLESITFSANGRFSFLLQSKQEDLLNDPEHPSYCEVMGPTQILASKAKSQQSIQNNGRATMNMVTLEKLAAMQSETLDSGIRRALLKAAF